jgi:predicted CoA-binding protein
VVIVIDHDMINRFLDLQRIAVVGVSRDRRQIANAIAHRLSDGGRIVYAVNDAADTETLDGLPAVRHLAELPGPVDGVLVVVPAARAAAVVREALEVGITKIWLHRGLGPSAVSDEALALARGRAEIVPGACPLMFLEPVRGVHRLHRRLAGAAPRRQPA